MKNFRKGFTLLEILLVVGIIAILAGITIVAINPSKQLAQVRNTERKSDLKQLYNAMTQFYIDKSYYPASTTISATLAEVCNTGSASATTTAVNGDSCDTLINLSELVPTYITAIPTDPTGTSSLLSFIPTAYAAPAATGTGYKVGVSDSKKVLLSAPLAELNVRVVVGDVPTLPPSATGGTITYTDSSGLNPRSSPAYSGGYTVHTFLLADSGTNFVVTGGSLTTSALVVAGGGGSSTWGGGGGGAGGVIFNTTKVVSSGTYPIVVGGGGIGTIAAPGGDGSNSVFDTLIAYGGGGGGAGSDTDGRPGGSGGGGGRSGYANRYGGAATSGQGNVGGNNVIYGSGGLSAGGGGGAGAAGSAPTGSWSGGKGGNGSLYSISGTNTYYGGGGGGSVFYGGGTPGTGGLGGGGAGGSGGPGIAGTPNTGGGAGGGGNTSTKVGGGSGIVIIRYLSS